MPYRNLNLNMPKIRVATGLYSHWDSIIKVDKKIVEWIEKSKEVKPGKVVLNSMEEIIFVLKDSIKNGDTESLISKNVYEKLDSLFPKRELRIGGNGNYMGQALFEVGIVPLVSYPTRSEKIMKFSPDFKIAVGNGFKNPKETAIKDDMDYDHVIFESSDWRSILSWDLMSSRGIFDNDFLRFAFDPDFTDIAIIAYAHQLLPEYKKRTEVILDCIKSNRPKIHLEFGDGCEESMRHAMERFSELEACDSWGLNEKECKIYLKAGSDSIKDLTDSAFEAIKDYNLKRICVHSSKFAFSVSKYDIKREIESLKAGCLVAGLKASSNINTKIHILKKKLNGYNFCLVPSFFNPKVKKLTGLGDAFAAIQAVKILS